MIFREIIWVALMNLKTNKLRTFLTVLGIVIGTTAVISVFSIGNSIKESVVSSMVNMGGNHVEVFLSTKKADIEYNPTENDLISNVMIDDFKERFSTEVGSVYITDELDGAEIRNRNASKRVLIQGVSEEYLQTHGSRILCGSDIRENHQNKRSMVAVVSIELLGDLGLNPNEIVGEKIRLDTYTHGFCEFTVIGVYEDDVPIFMNMSNVLFEEQAPIIYIPTFSARKIKGKGMGFTWFSYSVNNIENIELVREKSDIFFNQYYVSNTDYKIGTGNREGLLAEMNSLIKTITIFISTVASISLLVGGVGVMNIMLVCVTERTSEIGIRMALGAKKEHILFQFLAEAILLCFAGAFLGIVLGLSINYVISTILEYTVVIPIYIIIISVLVPVVVGIIFGYSPASKAANLNPVDAMRQE